MKTRMSNSTIHRFSRWVFATPLMQLFCGAASARFPDRYFEVLVNQGVSIQFPTSLPSGIQITAYDAPVSPALFGTFHGTVTGVGSIRIYRPFPGYMGTDQFQYNVRTAGPVVEGTVIITVRNGLVFSDTSIFETTSGSRTATFTANLLVVLPQTSNNSNAVSGRGRWEALL